MALITTKDLPQRRAEPSAGSRSMSAIAVTKSIKKSGILDAAPLDQVGPDVGRASGGRLAHRAWKSCCSFAKALSPELDEDPADGLDRLCSRC